MPVASGRSSALSVKQVVHAQPASLGPHLTVMRLLPSNGVQAVGPFVFMDHVGPMPSPRENVPAHPHAGIEVITYLISGSNVHRDSAGHSGRVTSGGAQWITAGRGMLHAERIGDEYDPVFHAVQLWTRLPPADEDCAAAYCAVDADSVPHRYIEGASERLLAGDLGEMHGPIELKQIALLAHLVLSPMSSVSLPLGEWQEAAVYVLAGEVRIGETRVLCRTGDLAILGEGTRLPLSNADGECELLILGGNRAGRPLVYHGSFVFGSEERARKADRDFRSGLMGQLDGIPPSGVSA